MNLNGTVNGQAPPTLLPQHLADLRLSDLTDATIAAAKLYSEADPERLAQLLNWGGRARYTNGPALVFPFFDADGKSMDFARIKPDTPRKDGLKYDSPARLSPRVYIPPGCTRAAVRSLTTALIITEGEKKALAADQHGFPTLALAGVDCWACPRPKDARCRGYGPFVLSGDLAGIAWQGRTVTIVFDSDTVDNRNVQLAAWRLARELKRHGATVKSTYPPSGPPGADGKPAKVGLDDLLLAGGPDALHKLLASAGEPTRPEDTRPVVVLGVEEHTAVEAAVKALAKGDHRLYQRGGQLVRVVRPSRSGQAQLVRLSGALRIDPVPLADLRIRICRVSSCRAITEKGERPAHPPKWLYEGIGSLGAWPGVRHLEAVVESPVLRADGSVLDLPGYDRATGLLYRPSGKFPPMPTAPTRADAVRACADLLEVVEDFPLAGPAHRSGFLSAVMTPLARHAFHGPAPLHNFDANVRGAGKGLMADTVAQIVAGRDFARAAYSTDSDEMGKSITALALSGEALVLLDNLVGAIGNASLDAALTAVEWQGRILGKSQQPRLPLRLTWYSSGNNTFFKADTARRVLQIRLDSSDERPEERSGFRHPDLLAWVRQERGRLLVAALTILTAYCRAGRPVQASLTPWGSFPDWTALVRGALVWAGQTDPGAARMSHADGGDHEATVLQGLLKGWKELEDGAPPDGSSGLTVAKALSLLADPTRAEQFPVMREVLADLFNLKPGQLPGTQQLGYRLRAFAGRNCGRKCFRSTKGHGGVARWHVQDVSTAGANQGCDGGDVSQRSSIPTSPSEVVSGGDGGNGVDVSPNPTREENQQHTVGTPGETSPPTPPSPPATADADIEEGVL